MRKEDPRTTIRWNSVSDLMKIKRAARARGLKVSAFIRKVVLEAAK